jgi:hypothetical protein
MKFRFKILVIGALLVLPLGANQQRNQSQKCSPCGDFTEVLKDYQRIKAGIPRKEVEKYFDREGGMQFPSAAHYIYPQCRYLHVDVKFGVSDKEHKPFSPDDTVLEVSRLYVDYPTKD